MQLVKEAQSLNWLFFPGGEDVAFLNFTTKTQRTQTSHLPQNKLKDSFCDHNFELKKHMTHLLSAARINYFC